ncbi:hypothetical protein [Streptosporangium roseum]|nr:hypothetical protein [Streptosporangium roseum]
MNRIETLMVTNPGRQVLQHWHETPLLMRLGSRTPGARTAEPPQPGAGGKYRTLIPHPAATTDHSSAHTGGMS